jgi:tripartite-type tricarboxylate transporter receptor subunit TctC
MMKLPRRKFLHLAAGAAALPAVSRIARAQGYPTRPIRLLIPFPPGGSFDAIGRPWADKMKTLLGTVVVENQGGASGTIAATTVVRAQPDGYTLLLAGAGQLGLYAITTNRPLYDPIKDLQPITVVAVTCYAIAVHPSVPAQNLKELAAYAKANPGKLSYGTAGVGSPNHLTGELFKSLTGADVVHVPYRGAGPAIVDAISGQIPMVIPAMNGQLIEFHRTGKLRILAVATPERLIGAPEIPTAAEAGVPGLFTQNLISLVAPAGTPKAIVDQIGAATLTGLADEKLQQQFIASGFEPPRDRSPETVRRWVEAEIVRWTPIVKAIGLNRD